MLLSKPPIPNAEITLVHNPVRPSRFSPLQLALYTMYSALMPLLLLLCNITLTMHAEQTYFLQEAP